MRIDVSRLEMVKTAGKGKVTARCPACARGGGDASGNHLIIYPDGRFGCAANQGDEEHRKEIWKLSGAVSRATRKPKPIQIRYEGW